MKRMRELVNLVEHESLKEGLNTSFFSAELKPGPEVQTDAELEVGMND